MKTTNKLATNQTFVHLLKSRLIMSGVKSNTEERTIHVNLQGAVDWRWKQSYYPLKKVDGALFTCRRIEYEGYSLELWIIFLQQFG